METYISINDSKETNKEIHMTNSDNEFTGKSVKIQKNESGDLSDIKDLFITKESVQDIDNVTLDSSCLEDLVDRFNKLLMALKGVEPSPSDE